jgi:hypothetical protein
MPAKDLLAKSRKIDRSCEGDDDRHRFVASLREFATDPSRAHPSRSSRERSEEDRVLVLLYRSIMSESPGGGKHLHPHDEKKDPGENPPAPSSPLSSSANSNGGQQQRHQKGVSFDNLEPLLKAMQDLKSAQQQQQQHPSSPPLLSQPFLLSGGDRPASLDASPR